MKSKTPKKYPFTLRDISDLLDLKLGIFSDKFEENLSNKFDEKLKTLEVRLSAKIGHSATGIIAEMDKRFAAVDDRFDEVDRKFEEVYKRFDTVEDKIQSLDERLIVQSERVKKVEKHSFVAI